MNEKESIDIESINEPFGFGRKKYRLLFDFGAMPLNRYLKFTVKNRLRTYIQAA